MNPFLLIAGPCVIEDEGLVLEVAQELKRQLQGLPVEWIFKASFDKANRTSVDGFRGPGMEEGLKIFSRLKAKIPGLKVLTDVHEIAQVEAVSEVVDFLQIPAFLCRQTDLVVHCAETALQKGLRLNIKKGQFLAPWDAKNIVEKVKTVEGKLRNAGKVSAALPEQWCFLTERGVTFGYNALVVDMAGFQVMKQFGFPVIYDATHSVQIPGAAPGGKSTGGKRENIEVLARAAIAAGADALFMECHPRPESAKSDGPNAFPLLKTGEMIRQLLEIRKLVSAFPRLVAPN